MTVEEVLSLLKRSFDAGRLAHAYVVEGNPRSEGGALAERLLAMVECSGKDKPCGQCRGCSLAVKRLHPDIVWVEPQTKSRKIEIEQIRWVREQLNQSSLTGGWKGCVLVCADRLTIESSNAFLKTLEEPPGQCLFLLLTENPQSLLPTIVSRCQYVRVDEADAGENEEWMWEFLQILSEGSEHCLKNRSRGARDEESAALTALWQSARIGALLAQLKQMAEEEIRRQNESTRDKEEVEDPDVTAARISARYRELRMRLVRAMLWWYRDVLLLVCGGAPEHLHYRSHAELLRRIAGFTTRQQALRNLRAVENMHRQMEMHLPEGLVLEVGLGQLSF